MSNLFILWIRFMKYDDLKIKENTTKIYYRLKLKVNFYEYRNKFLKSLILVRYL